MSIENAPELIRPAPPEGAKRWALTCNASEVFVKLLSKDEFATTEPGALSAQGRGENSRGIGWYGWCKFSPAYLMPIFRETDKGDIETFFEHTDKLITI
jgi:hypothetical protein